MTGHEFKAIRQKLGLSVYDWGRALGYSGNRNTVYVQVARYESENRDIPLWIERLAIMYDRYGVPEDFIPSETV